MRSSAGPGTLRKAEGHEHGLNGSPTSVKFILNKLLVIVLDPVVVDGLAIYKTGNSRSAVQVYNTDTKSPRAYPALRKVTACGRLSPALCSHD